ncbi:MAG: capsular exopolysaccharide family [Phycisphaerales bacterium]|nr:capsular exopolysaccharide family [Phycisphaerales bacterium]
MAVQSNRSNTDAATRQQSIVEILWHRKQLVAIVFLLCLVSAAVLLKLTKKRVPVLSRLEVTRTLAANTDPNTVDLPTFLNTQAELIRSATVLSSAMGAPGMDSLTLLADSENPINTLKDKLDVRPIPQSSVIVVRLTSTNVDEATQIVDAVDKAYLGYVEDQKKRNAAADYYTKVSQDRARLDEQRSDAKKLLLTLQAETGALFGPGDSSTNMAVQKLRQLSESLTTAQLANVQYKSELEDALKTVGMTPDKIDQAKLASATVVSPESLPVLKNNLAGLSQQLIEAKRQFVPSHPAVRQVQAQIKDLQLAQAATLVTVSQSATRKEQEARQLYAEQEKVTQNINAKAAELAVLTDRVKGLDTQLSRLDGTLQKLTVVESVGIDAKVIDDPDADYASQTPDTKKTLGLAALIGLALGMLAGLTREWISPSLGAVHRIADTVGVPLLGTLPRVPGYTPSELAKLSFDAADTDAAEAFRSVRTSLLFGADQCQTIAITSPATGDGKTTLASNLAILLAQSGKRVALIDADFRQPSLHTIFGLDNPVGLSGVLNGDDIDTATRRTAIEHLDILTAGPASGEVSQQLNSPRFNEILRELKGRYDHILFDTSGVVGSNDARVIAAGCDTTLLVMRDERTTRFAATTARDALLSVGAMLMGIVLNDAAKTGPSYPNSVGGRDKGAGGTLIPGSGSRERARW